MFSDISNRLGRTLTGNFKTDGKIDEFIDMFTEFNMKGEDKSTFTFKFLVGMSDA